MQSVTVDDVRAARRRIADRVRLTPVLEPHVVRDTVMASARLFLKLECLQVTGSFKARGAMSKLTSLDEAEIARGLITASGGNHGLGVAYAGWASQVPVRIYLPENTPAAKAESLRGWGADVVMHGAVWDDANRAALAAAERDGMTYVHPFADPQVIAGQGTTALELLEQVPDADLLVVAIGGGGLISGISLAAKALRPDLRIVGVEPTGAPTLHDSIEAGALVTLDAIDTRANTLAPRRSEQINLDIIRAHVDEIVLVEDRDMRAAAGWLWRECAVAAELSGAAAVAALMTGACRPAAGQRVAALVCGAGTDGMADAGAALTTAGGGSDNQRPRRAER